MKRKLVLTATLAMVLSACASQEKIEPAKINPLATAPVMIAKPPYDVNKIPDSKFVCKNGMTATVKYDAGEGKIHLHIDTVGQTTLLEQVETKKGRWFKTKKGFFGNTTEYYNNGDNTVTVVLHDPKGNLVKTTCKLPASK